MTWEERVYEGLSAILSRRMGKFRGSANQSWRIGKLGGGTCLALHLFDSYYFFGFACACDQSPQRLYHLRLWWWWWIPHGKGGVYKCSCQLFLHVYSIILSCLAALVDFFLIVIIIIRRWRGELGGEQRHPAWAHWQIQGKRHPVLAQWQIRGGHIFGTLLFDGITYFGTYVLVIKAQGGCIT